MFLVTFNIGLGENGEENGETERQTDRKGWFGEGGWGGEGLQAIPRGKPMFGTRTSKLQCLLLWT